MLSQDEALAYLRKRLSPIKDPTKYLAGFVTSAGKQLALNRQLPQVSVFVEAGRWDEIVPGLELKRTYGANDERNSNLAANAPRLKLGCPVVHLGVPTLEGLAGLCDAYDAADVTRGDALNKPVQVVIPSPAIETGNAMSLNRILFGPPGTGKTYKTAELAVRICDGLVPATRGLLMARYEELRKNGRISFVTFHQSYSYEDFVEGLRPELNDGVISYAVRPGILRDACDAARRSTLAVPGLAGKPLKDRTIYKMSLGRAGTTEGKLVFQECMEAQHVLLGWGDDVDFSDCDSLEAILARLKEAEKPLERPDSAARYVNVFKNELQVGDIIIASQGNSAFRAIGEVTGEYEFLEAPAAGRFHQMRRVRWLAVFEGNHAVTEIYDRTFVQSTLYKLVPSGLNFAALEGLVQPNAGTTSHAFVLIIDEINRANISKVFGELITLIEPDKRAGELNALTVRLPYSGSDFSVPSNLYVVGTMNTADRSIALLDTALRRRFEFEELEPNYFVLPEAPVSGVDLRLMLRALNARIEYLYDRDHAIGHAYFMHVATLSDLDRVFRRKVLPLLQEYFYEDWSKVRSVLSDTAGSFIEADSQIPKGLGAVAETYDAKPRYSVRKDAFPLSGYLKIYE